MAAHPYQHIYQLVAQIPVGQVTTYGTIAKLISVPRGARGVGWAMAVCRDAQIPWWRVVAAQGRITSPDAPLQYDLLCHEGVPMRAYLHVDIALCAWTATNL